MKKIALIGYGEYGKAILTLINREKFSSIGIISDHYHSVDSTKKQISINFEDLNNDYSAVIIATASSKLDKTINELRNISYQGLILNFVKAITNEGLIGSKIKTLGLENTYCYIAGAGFASDIILGSKLNLCISSWNKNNIRFIEDLFLSSRISWTRYNNPEMAELISSLKNVYSIYLGFISASNPTETDKINHLIGCFEEMNTIVTELQCDTKILFSSAGFGDLVLCSNSISSRNYFFGLALGKIGLNKSENLLIEGLNTVKFIQNVIPERIWQKLSILSSINSLLSNRKSHTPSIPVKTIITYGTYDLFHHGHMALLRRAKNRGDFLIVGLSTDEFNLLKGKRSVQSYEERKRNLLALNIVDLVIPENSWDQKISDIEEHQVDLFVMGHDWEGKFDELEKYCAVEYLRRTEGISTTILKKNLGFNQKL